MRLRSALATGSLAAALLLATGSASAKMNKPCSMTGASPQFDSSRASQESLNLMSDISTKSRDVAAEADKLLIRKPLTDDRWQLQADELNVVKNEINHMGKDLGRLEHIRSTLPAWEQAAIDQAAQKLQLMAIHTSDALDYLKATRTGLRRPEFRKFESNLQAEALQLHRLMGEYVSYARVHARDNSLARDLNLNTDS